jgi:hypothetical protein
MWEIFSFGAIPYTDMTNAEAMRAVINGYQLSKPEACPDPIWTIVTHCWKPVSYYSLQLY